MKPLNFLSTGMLLILSAAAMAHSEAFPKNSLGAVAIAHGFYGVSYERTLSSYLSMNCIATASGNINFCGVRLMLSRNDTELQFRPSIGFSAARGQSEDDPSREWSPWMGYLWPGMGINWRMDRISVSIDGFTANGKHNSGSFDEGFFSLSGSVMYMF